MLSGLGDEVILALDVPNGQGQFVLEELTGIGWFLGDESLKFLHFLENIIVLR